LNTSLIFGLAPEESETVATAWIAVGGRHTIGVEVDRPYQRIGEEDESNNSASITIPVQAPALLPSELGGLRIAVARFEDDTGSRFVNVGEGVADKLADRLCAGGSSRRRPSSVRTSPSPGGSRGSTGNRSRST